MKFIKDFYLEEDKILDKIDTSYMDKAQRGIADKIEMYLKHIINLARAMYLQDSPFLDKEIDDFLKKVLVKLIFRLNDISVNDVCDATMKKLEQVCNGVHKDYGVRVDHLIRDFDNGYTNEEQQLRHALNCHKTINDLKHTFLISNCVKVKPKPQITIYIGSPFSFLNEKSDIEYGDGDYFWNFLFFLSKQFITDKDE